MATRQRFKRQERETASLLGGKRNPCTGGPHQDVTTPLFGVEQKTKEKLPAWLTKAVRQAVGTCKDGQVPIVVLTEVRQGVKAKRFVFCRIEDWIELHGEEVL